MKKKLMFLAVAALFLSGGVFTAMQLTNKEKVSGFTLANIKAMAIGDFEGGGCQDKVERRDGLIVVTVCKRTTSFKDALANVKCGTISESSCQFYNIG